MYSPVTAAPLTPPPTPKPDGAAPGTAPTLAPPSPAPESPSDRIEAPIKPTGLTQISGPTDSGSLTLYVPADAKVYINGMETKSVGSQRQYMSYGLEHGKTYPYTIKALMLVKPDASAGSEPAVEGEVASESQREEARKWTWVSRTVYLKAGENQSVSFSDDPVIQKSAENLEAHRTYEKEQRLQEADGWTASISR